MLFRSGGVAFLIECLSDNRNRAASDVRVAVTRNGGTMADPGSVAYMFHRKGIVAVAKSQKGRVITEEELLEVVLEHGAEDVNDLGENFEVISAPTDLVAIRKALENSGMEYESAEVSYQPSVMVPLEKAEAQSVLSLIDAIEDLDDVQNVFANFDLSDEVMASLS